MDSLPKRRSDVLLSVVAPAHDAGERLESFVRGVCGVLAERFTDYEVVIVDNASRDDSAERLSRLQRELRNIQVYRLARAVDLDTCFVVGLERAVGDIVISMDAARDPVECIAEMIELYERSGADIVFGIARERLEAAVHSGLYDWAAKGFFAAYRWITKDDLPRAASTFRLYSRRSLNSFLDNRDRYALFPVLASFSGYGYREFVYEARPGGERAPRKPLLEASGRALRILLLSSPRPLRLLSLFALAGALLNVLYTVYVVAVNIFKSQVAEGWTSLSLQLSLMFFVLFLILAALCEYIVRMFMHGQERPSYNIASESHSLVLARKDELNVRNLSED